jgi:uncharacterized protein
MDFSYAITPFIAWLVAGLLKFAINSIRSGQWAFGQIGYGGLPSNHSALVSSTVALVAFREGIGHPAFGVAVTLAFIVMLDANSLRRQIGKQAAIINYLAREDEGVQVLRERMGHTRLEIVAGILVGVLVAWVANLVTAQHVVTI